MHPVFRRNWPYLALLAGGTLVLFELRRGISGDNWFWLLIGALVVVMAAIDLLQRRSGTPRDPHDPGDPGPKDLLR